MNAICYSSIFYIYSMTHRRNFLKKSAALLGSSLLIHPLMADPPFGPGEKLKRIGVQLFSIPKIVEKDFAGTMKMLAGLGYKEIEFFGPYPFSPAAEKEGWNAVTPSLGFSGSGFFGLDPKQVRKILDDNGLSAPSMHSGLPTLEQAMDALAGAANILGATYVTLPSAATQKDLDGYKKQAEQFNRIGESAARQGVRFAYHNHGNGLQPLNGTVPFELLMQNTDPAKVFFQMDIFWMTAGGVNVVDYLKKFKGRFKLMHVKDMSQRVRFSGDGGDSKQWIDLFPYLTNAGSGVLDVKSILSEAQKSGVEHFIIERDLAPNPGDDLKKSFDYVTAVEL
jgi:sugar phosphate isomerase/epimerase